MSAVLTVVRRPSCCACSDSTSATCPGDSRPRRTRRQRRSRPMKEPVNKITLKDGSVRYRLVVDVGRDKSGKRKQLTRTFDTQREARDELARIRHETNLGIYVRPSLETVNSYLDGYLKGALRGRRASTRRNYADALLPVRERLGTRPLQSISQADV